MMKELTIHHLPADGNRPARVRVGYRPSEGSQVQEREAEFQFAFTNEERGLIQWYLEEYLLFPWGEFRNRAAAAEALMERKGDELFHAVFCDDETTELYARVMDDLLDTRIHISASDPADISIPWELMRGPVGKGNGDIARLAHAFVRGQPDTSYDPSAFPSAATFNILMVICRPGGPEGDVPFQSVARSLLELFRPHPDRIRLDILRPPTFERLAEVLASKPNYYHVLHFDGHGTFPHAGATKQVQALLKLQGQLMFEREDGGLRAVKGEELGKLLAGKGVPAVILNACQSGMTYPEALYPSLGNQILLAGVGGVVAMAYSVYVEAARQFMARLYQGLINGEELARAAAIAREGLGEHPDRFSPVGMVPIRDWIVPVVLQTGPIRLVPESPRSLQLGDAPSGYRQEAGDAEINFPASSPLGLVGRDGVLLEMERAFQEQTVVLLGGWAGAGKTEVALSFARWRAETGGLNGAAFFFSFEHYLPLARVCDGVGQLFSEAIHKLTGRDWSLMTLDQQRQVALAILREVPCLLIWDNFEPVKGFPSWATSQWTTQEQGELRDFLRDLRGGQTKVILTSRRDEAWLGGIYSRVGIGGLKLREAQELGYSVIRHSGMNLSEIRHLPPQSSNELLNHLGGNPLVIQAVLPDLQRKGPDALLTALQSGDVSRLEDTAFGDDIPAQGRRNSLTSSLTYGLDALDLPTRRRLGLLGMFQRCVSAKALAAFSTVEEVPELLRGLDQEGWVGILAQADEVGLVSRVDDGYYLIHPALPWFLHSQLREAFAEHREWLEKTYVANYAGYASMLTRGLQDRAQESLMFLDAEEGNIKYALRLATQFERWDDVRDIFSGLDRLLEVKGREMECDHLAAELEVCVDNQGIPVPGRENCWVSVVRIRQHIAFRRGDIAAAAGFLVRLRKHFEAVKDEEELAACYHQLGLCAYERRLFREAQGWFLQSLEIKRRFGDEGRQAATLHELGLAAQQLRQFDEAEGWLLQALAIRERLQDEQGQSYTLHAMGMNAQETGQFDKAKELILQCLEINRRLGDENGQAASLFHLGLVAQLQELWKEAEAWYRQSLTIRVRLGDEHGQATLLNQLGRVAFGRRLFEEAEHWYRDGLSLFKALGKDDAAEVLSNLGMVALERHEFDEAEDWLLQALAIRERQEDKVREAATLSALGQVEERRGEKDGAMQYYAKAEAVLNRAEAAST